MTKLIALILLAMAQPQKPLAVPDQPAFDVASIKVNNSGGSRSHVWHQDATLTTENVSLDRIIRMAYNLKEHELIGPDWLRSESFDIIGKATVAEPSATLDAMLQPFLAEQFKLVVHRETRNLPVYALVVAKGKPRFSPVRVGAESDSVTENHNPKGASLDATAGMARLAEILSAETDRPVIDRTNLEGSFVLKMNWWPDSNNGNNEEGQPSIYTALEEQLGLKLMPTTGPVAVLVIDHIEKQPVGN